VYCEGVVRRIVSEGHLEEIGFFLNPADSPIETIHSTLSLLLILSSYSKSTCLSVVRMLNRGGEMRDMFGELVSYSKQTSEQTISSFSSCHFSFQILHQMLIHCPNLQIHEFLVPSTSKSSVFIACIFKIRFLPADLVFLYFFYFKSFL